MGRSYLPFELLIGASTDQGYLVTVVDSPAGDGEAHCTLRIDAELEDVVAALEAGRADQNFLIELGAFFFNELFTGPIATLYRTSLGMARSQAKRLRIRLRITPPELAALPWEYLYDGQEDAFLAISAETALVRYVPISLPVRPTAVTLPLRVLVVIAMPQEMQQLEVEREKAIVQAALAEGEQQGRIQLEILERAVTAEISAALRRFQPHIFHFIGHGLFEREGAYVILEDEKGSATRVDERTFRELFTGCQEMRLAILNACQTATLSATQPLVGLAPRLLQRQLSAVVAMQHPIPDATSLIFTREFYRSLAQGAPVDAAISEARRGIFVESNGQSPTWGTPVLFLRAKDGLLFTVADDAPKSLAIPAPPEPVRPPEMLSFVGRDAELTYFAEKLEATHLAVIAGMAGVGKTALAVKLTEWVARERDRVFWHSFHEGEGIDAILWRLAGFLAWHGRDDLWKLLQSTRLTGGKPPPSESLFDYVLQLSRGGQFLFCFDDFHHVEDDPALTQLIARLRSALSAGELAIILTSRRAPDFVTLAEFKPLVGLSVTDARQLLLLRGLQLTATQVEELYKYTAGNAEFLTLAIHALQQAKNPDLLIGRLAESDDIERYLLQEVDETLTGQERGVMNAVAVLLGYAGTRHAIESVLTAGNLFRTLRQLTERHLLTARDGEAGREYLQHAMVRTFYYEQNNVRERRGMHRRAGAYYETEEPDLLRAGIHFERAGEYERAAGIATKDIWAIINRGEARVLRLLLERFPQESLDVELWIEVLIASGQVYHFTSERERSSNCYALALEQLTGMTNTADVAVRHARACRGMGELLQLENPQEALYWFERGLAAVTTDMPLEAAALRIQMGITHVLVGDYEVARNALELGLQALGNQPSQLRSSALASRGAIELYQGNLAQAIIFTESALKINRQLNDSIRTVIDLTDLSIEKYSLGNWTEAIADFHQALDLARQLGSEQLQATVTVNLGAAYINLGDSEAAAQHLQNSLLLAQKNNLHAITAIAQLRLADLQIRLAQWQQAEASTQAAEQAARQIGDDSALIAIYRAAAELKLATGDVSGALADIEHSLTLAQELDEALEEGQSLRTLGQIQRKRNDHQQALNSYEKSLALLLDNEPYEAARTKVEWSKALLVAGNQEAGVRLLLAAKRTFQTFGAKRDLAEVELLLPS